MSIDHRDAFMPVSCRVSLRRSAPRTALAARAPPARARPVFFISIFFLLTRAGLAVSIATFSTHRRSTYIPSIGTARVT